MTKDERLRLLGTYVSPESPIRATEFLRGRDSELETIETELRHFKGIPFIFGERGTGKTSLARTAAQQVTSSDREHIYVACAPGARMLTIFREIAHELISVASRLRNLSELRKIVEVNMSMNPGIKLSLENKKPELAEFDNVNTAVRTLREIDSLLPNARETVIIIDELEELNDGDRRDLAFLVKQVGDQEFGFRLMLVGIAENVQELIGAHESVPRYIKEVGLSPLTPQILMDIVKDAAKHVQVQMDAEPLYRIAIIGNGYPHFAHLMGKTILTEAILAESDTVTPEIYSRGVTRAVNGSIQQLRISYEAATQRREDLYKHLVWALADTNTVDVRIDDWIRIYHELAGRQSWRIEDDSRVRTSISRLNQKPYGQLVTNTPIRYGDSATRYRYKRFANNLMRGHVRLQAEREQVYLGGMITL